MNRADPNHWSKEGRLVLNLGILSNFGTMSWIRCEGRFEGSKPHFVTLVNKISFDNWCHISYYRARTNREPNSFPVYEGIHSKIEWAAIPRSAVGGRTIRKHPGDHGLPVGQDERTREG